MLPSCSALFVVGALLFVTADAVEYYRLVHLEYASTFLDVTGDPQDTNRKAAAGLALATHRGAGQYFYTDDKGRVRTKIDDLCIHEGSHSVLELAKCSDDDKDWRYYFNQQTYVAGLILGSDASPKSIAVWQNKKDVYELSGSKLVSKPFGAFKDDFGAEWYRKYNKRRHHRLY